MIQVTIPQHHSPLDDLFSSGHSLQSYSHSKATPQALKPSCYFSPAKLLLLKLPTNPGHSTTQFNSQLPTVLCCAQSLGHVQLFATPCDPHGSSVHWHSSRQEYWSGLPCPPPGDLPNPRIKPRSPTLRVDSLPSELPGKPQLPTALSLLFYCLIPILFLQLHYKLFEAGVIHVCVSHPSQHMVGNVDGICGLPGLIIHYKSHSIYTIGGSCRQVGNAWGKDNLALNSIHAGHDLFFPNRGSPGCKLTFLWL